MCCCWRDVDCEEGTGGCVPYEEKLGGYRVKEGKNARDVFGKREGRIKASGHW